MPKLTTNKIEKDKDEYIVNLENWKKYIHICLEENNYLYAEFEICHIYNKTVLSIFNGYGLLNIHKRYLLEQIDKLMREKSFQYIISTRAKTDSYNYFIVLSILHKNF